MGVYESELNEFMKSHPALGRLYALTFAVFALWPIAVPFCVIWNGVDSAKGREEFSPKTEILAGWQEFKWLLRVALLPWRRTDWRWSE